MADIGLNALRSISRQQLSFDIPTHRMDFSNPVIGTPASMQSPYYFPSTEKKILTGEAILAGNALTCRSERYYLSSPAGGEACDEIAFESGAENQLIRVYRNGDFAKIPNAVFTVSTPAERVWLMTPAPVNLTTNLVSPVDGFCLQSCGYAVRNDVMLVKIEDGILFDI